VKKKFPVFVFLFGIFVINLCYIIREISLWIPNKHMMTINFDTITNNYEVIYVIKTVMKYQLKKIDTSFHQPLPNMVQRLFAVANVFFKEDIPNIIPANFGSNWPCTLRVEHFCIIARNHG
jgi:hypothetical protein